MPPVILLVVMHFTVNENSPAERLRRAVGSPHTALRNQTTFVKPGTATAYQPSEFGMME